MLEMGKVYTPSFEYLKIYKKNDMFSHVSPRLQWSFCCSGTKHKSCVLSMNAKIFFLVCIWLPLSGI